MRPAPEKELAQLAAEQPQRCRQEGKRVLQAIGGDGAPRSDVTTKRMAELDARGRFSEQYAEGWCVTMDT